ncbi:hypothetical protein BO99DRAFT_400071 [Aspergillus violaceofuscus CBS 115571]|uniref:Uncharacterized protein n=1 Tax=Aspergillus violaceofuscus (strain CBS 115571) TaxID=1450538 RepID=A0A2V5I181_ASPV1|nr:hypothetical protein BO99DRAFT_400071 [Aspergillus violaceofuscus CBS 115571]
MSACHSTPGWYFFKLLLPLSPHASLFLPVLVVRNLSTLLTHDSSSGVALVLRPSRREVD